MIALLILLVFCSQVSETGRTPDQTESDPATEVDEQSESSSDSVLLIQPEEEIIVIRRKSPTGALLRSAALPGWGQFYNENPLKGIVMGSAELGLLAWLLHEHIAAEDARTDYLETGDPADESRYDSHSQRRMDLIWYTSAAWLYGMLDAYVDAYLFSFESENRSFERKAGIGAIVYFRF